MNVVLVSKDSYLKAIDELPDTAVIRRMTSLGRHFAASFVISRWCEQHCKGFWDYRNGGEYHFENPNDAMLFKLTWA